MATLSVEETSSNYGGSVNDLTLNAADVAGDVFPNDGKTVIQVVNGSGSSVTVTVAGGTDPQTGLAYADLEKVIAAGDTALVGPFHRDQFNNGSGQVSLTYSAVASLTVGVARLAGFQPVQ